MKEFDDVSVAARDLVRRCLRRDPATRPSAADMLRHPWLAQQQSTKSLDGAIAGLRRHKARRRFRVALKALMVGSEFNVRREISAIVGETSLGRAQVVAMRKAFFRVAPTGRVGPAQFGTVMQVMGLGHMPLDRLFQLFDRPPIGEYTHVQMQSPSVKASAALTHTSVCWLCWL